MDMIAFVIYIVYISTGIGFGKVEFDPILGEKEYCRQLVMHITDISI